MTNLQKKLLSSLVATQVFTGWGHRSFYDILVCCHTVTGGREEYSLGDNEVDPVHGLVGGHVPDEVNAEEVFVIKAAAKVFLALCPHGLLRRGRGGEAVDVGAGQQQLLVPQLGPVARASNQGYPKVHEDFTMNGLKHLLVLSHQRHY